MCGSEGCAALGAELGLLVIGRPALGTLHNRSRCFSSRGRCFSRNRCSRWCRCCILGRCNTLGVHDGTATSIAKAVGPKVLAVTRLAVHLAVVVAQRRRVQKLAARLALEAHLVPLPTRTLCTLCKVHCLATPRTLTHRLCFVERVKKMKGEKKKERKRSVKKDEKDKKKKTETRLTEWIRLWATSNLRLRGALCLGAGVQ